jgi:aryl-alcohol dehydrogenase-like predicted oxidoreductase
MGRAGIDVSEIGFGGWAIGGAWGEVSEADAMASLHEAVERGVTFFDTADVYGDGRSERLIARLRRERPDAEIVIATKAGRRLDPHVASGYTIENIEGFVDRSLGNLEAERLDLLQLHCPPTDVYYHPELFAGLDGLVAKGKLARYGVSVERVEEALKAIEYPGVASVQIIFNMFRHRPAERFFAAAADVGVGVIVRVPLASGLLTGKMSPSSKFASDDHRHFNRQGEAFDVGETFAGVPFDRGLKAVDALRNLVPEKATMAQFALRWILMHDAVSTAIPGAKRPAQVADNAAASELALLNAATMARIAEIYEELVRPYVHDRW